MYSWNEGCGYSLNKNKEFKVKCTLCWHVQEAFFGKDLLDKSKQSRQQASEPGLLEDGQTQVERKPNPSSFMGSSSDPMLGVPRANFPLRATAARTYTAYVSLLRVNLVFFKMIILCDQKVGAVQQVMIFRGFSVAFHYDVLLSFIAISVSSSQIVLGQRTRTYFWSFEHINNWCLKCHSFLPHSTLPHWKHLMTELKCILLIVFAVTMSPWMWI